MLESPCIPVKYPLLDSLRESLPKAQEVIAKSQRIVIGGGGPVGIELAGEIAEAYPGKSVTMVFAGFRLLDNLKGSASIEAGKKLNKMGIVVRSGAKVCVFFGFVLRRTAMSESESEIKYESKTDSVFR